jgi:hypothetical protein
MAAFLTSSTLTTSPFGPLDCNTLLHTHHFMVAIALVIASKSGHILVSRLFVPLSKSRLDTFISGFFAKLNAMDQSTLVQGDIVNFLFKPMDTSFMLILVTNKESNIVSDINALNLASSILGDICHPLSLEAIESHCFELVFAIDELFPLSLLNETPSATQVFANLAMDSANEKLEEMITKDKEKETKQKAKEKMKQLEMQRREAARKVSSGGSGLHRPDSCAATNVPMPFSAHLNDIESRPSAKYLLVVCLHASPILVWLVGLRHCVVECNSPKRNSSFRSRRFKASETRPLRILRLAMTFRRNLPFQGWFRGCSALL